MIVGDADEDVSRVGQRIDAVQLTGLNPRSEDCVPSFDYDAFASYATDPDRDLVRRLEAFIEGFTEDRHFRKQCVDR